MLKHSLQVEDVNHDDERLIKVTSNLSPEARDEKEDWSGLKDAAQRRKLQNRLHQRAWRKRQAAARRLARSNDHLSPSTSTSSSSPQTLQESEDEVDLPLSVFKTKDEVLLRSIMRLEKALTDQTIRGGPRLELLSSLIKFNVYRAFRENNESLRFDMAWRSDDGLSPFFTMGSDSLMQLTPYPDHLKPTKLQMAIEHHPWIDLLPFPAMRDNILRRGEEYDDWPLCYDILEDMQNDRSGLIVWGEPSNPLNWEVTEAFLRRWLWAIQGCSELFAATNDWRLKRGEPKLFPDALCRRSIDIDVHHRVQD